jgi:uncharacterized membrane protein (DUF106 family)
MAAVKNSTLHIDNIRTVLTIIVSSIVIITAITTFASSQMDEITSIHKEDIKEVRAEIVEVQKNIDQKSVEQYTDQIHILESNPNASTHDQNTVKYLKGRKADLILRMN